MGTGTGTGVIGDPYFMSRSGELIEFSGSPSLSYLFASDGQVEVVFRIASVPADPLKTMVDQVAITVPGPHTIVVGLSALTVDGHARAKSAAPVPVGSGSAWWHVDPDGTTSPEGDARVDISWGGWAVAVIQDPGTSLALHPATSPLRDVLHLGLFVDAHPALDLLSGLITAVGPPIVPASYLAP